MLLATMPSSALGPGPDMGAGSVLRRRHARREQDYDAAGTPGETGFGNWRENQHGAMTPACCGSPLHARAGRRCSCVWPALVAAQEMQEPELPGACSKHGDLASGRSPLIQVSRLTFDPRCPRLPSSQAPHHRRCMCWLT